MFQNLRLNSAFSLLHKDAVPYIAQGSLVSVSSPKPKYPSSPAIGQFPQMEMVVDLVVSVNGNNMNLQGLPAGLEIADFGHNGNIVVSSSKEAINNEISLMRHRSAEIIGSVDFHRNVISACEKMLSELNPEVAEKQRQEQEISTLKGQMQRMSENMNSLMEMNRKLMEQLGVTETK